MKSIDDIVKQATYPKFVEFEIIQKAFDCCGQEIE